MAREEHPDASPAEEAGELAAPEPPPAAVRRRTILRYLGWSGLTAFLAFLGSLTVRLFWPRVLMEPSTRFEAGFPSEYAVGEVNSAFLASHRVWIVREATGIYALVARCTHLGCTPVWLESKSVFKCPCHGSGFTREGIQFEGPAPRPLERAHISLAPDGRIQVDTARVYRKERGEWEAEGAFLKT